MRGNSLTFAGCPHIAFEGWINQRLLCLAAWFAQG